MSRKLIQIFSMLIVLLLFAQCTKKLGEMKTTSNANKATSANALLQEWTGPYNGVPPFDKVQISDFKPAFEAAMHEKNMEINAITRVRSMPDFENTIEALEKAGRTYKRVEAIYEIWKSNMSSPELNTVVSELEPKLAAFRDSVYQNLELFRRIEQVYQSPQMKHLTPEQQRVTWRYYTNFVLAGAKLNESDKAKVAVINQKLASIFSTFSQHLLSDEGDKYLALNSEKELDGMPSDFKEAAAEEATSKNLKNTWVIANTRSSIEPFLTYATDRNLREKAWNMFVKRGDNNDANDNKALITEILLLRAERAKLLGYATHAHWRLADKMAKTPENAMKLLESVWTPAVERVKEEVRDMQAIADKEGAGIKIAPWDYRFYAEKVRKAKYDLDQDEVKQYMQLDKMREAIFFVADKLFDLQFVQVHDVPVFHPDVSVYKVLNKNSGKQIGLWYFDPYARKGKRSGAWMTAYREQEKLSGNVTTIVSNNCNFIKGKPGEPVLISWDDAETLFHEFGHALHGLNSDVTYPLLSGTNTATDYVEFPSQVLERWLSTPEVLNKFALHYKTGKPLPKELLAKIENSSKFNQGFATVEYLASALVDMKLHLAGAKRIDPAVFEKETLDAYHMPAEIVMRHRMPQFAHIFADDGYSAGYYSYLWSDVLSSDAYEAFTEAGGPYDKTVAKRLHDYVFCVGGTMDEAEAYRKFRGHDPNPDALMRSRGFVPEKK